ncbi:MAG: hypothetical protein MJ188_06760 [Treponema sp.]|nr:hypothetical protein [Treponema sp.]
MESRHSVRQYVDKPIESDKRDVLNKMIQEFNTAANLNIQIFYDEPNCFNSLLAHYGKFSGVSNYICMVGPKSVDLDEKVGYYGEKLVLKAQELGLNTCWVASTHGKSAAKIEKGQKQAIIISLGYGANQGHVHKNKENLAQLSNDNPEWYKTGVKAALLAPTAINQQKFFIERNGEEITITAKSGPCAKIDLGIVKCHFEMASGHKVL